MNYTLIKKITKVKLKREFDKIYESVRLLAEEKYDYKGELKIVSDNKWVNFYISND